MCSASLAEWGMSARLRIHNCDGHVCWCEWGWGNTLHHIGLFWELPSSAQSALVSVSSTSSTSSYFFLIQLFFQFVMCWLNTSRSALRWAVCSVLAPWHRFIIKWCRVFKGDVAWQDHTDPFCSCCHQNEHECWITPHLLGNQSMCQTHPHPPPSPKRN